MCSALIHITRISRVVYACSWKDIHDVIDITGLFDYVSTPIEKRSTPSVVIGGGKAEQIVRRWFADQNE